MILKIENNNLKISKGENMSEDINNTQIMVKN